MTETNSPVVIMTIGSPRVSRRITDAGVVIQKELVVVAAQQLVDEIATTTATGIIFHAAQISGEPKRKFLMRLRSANNNIAIVMLIPSGEKDERLQKTYTEARIVTIKENARDLPAQIIRAVGGNEMEPPPMEKALPETETTISTPPKEVEAKTAKAKPEKRPLRMPLLPEKKATKKKQSHQPVTLAPKALHTTIIIPVYTSNRGVGSTWLTLQAATYLTSKGLSCAIIGHADMQNLSPRPGVKQFNDNGIEFYIDADVAQIYANGYDYILLDIGQVLQCMADGTATPVATQAQLQEIARAPIKLFIVDTAPWRKEVNELFSNPVWMPIITNATVFLPYRLGAPAQAFMQKQYETETHLLPESAAYTLTTELNRYLAATLNV